MDGTRDVKMKYSVQMRFIATFFILIGALLVLMNTYPIFASRDLVFTSKQTLLQNQASVMAAALSPLDSLSVDSVTNVMELLDVMPLSRVIITDETGMVLYDTSEGEREIGYYALFSEIARALGGEAVFYSHFTGEAFMSRAASPVRSRGNTTGAVYLYEYDTEQARLIVSIQNNLRNVSLATVLLAPFLVLIFTRLLTRRITELVRAMRIVRGGEYDHRIKIRGNDELSELGEEFNTLTTRLQDTEEARRRFVSDASHELRTPLASIRLLSDNILQSENIDVATVREFVSDIGSEAERLQRTTEKLLSLTRMDRDTLVPRRPVNLARVVSHTLGMLTHLAGENDVTLEMDMKDDCYIYASEDDIYGVVFNLVENAIKYNMPDGRVTVTLERDEEIAELKVDDTGIGIPSEDVPHIFARFYRVDKARSREAGGSGLGLSIVHDAVKLHGGEVEVEHLEPHGTSFRVRFPVYMPLEGEE